MAAQTETSLDIYLAKVVSIFASYLLLFALHHHSHAIRSDTQCAKMFEEIETIEYAMALHLLYNGSQQLCSLRFDLYIFLTNILCFVCVFARVSARHVCRPEFVLIFVFVSPLEIWLFWKSAKRMSFTLWELSEQERSSKLKTKLIHYTTLHDDNATNKKKTHTRHFAQQTCGETNVRPVALSMIFATTTIWHLVRAKKRFTVI